MIFENDTISVKSKKQAAEHIIERYNHFGWTLIEKKDDRLYENITHLTFTRPHFIENRDYLQLLQVRLEIAYNKMGRLSYCIPVRTALVASLLGLLAAGCIAGGVILLLLLDGLISVISGAVLCATGTVSGAICAVSAPRMYRKDRDKYSLLIDEQVQKIDELCKRATELRGEHE